RALQATRGHPRAIVGHRFASHGAPHYNEPGGWLFGEKPLPPGQKRVKEDWENIWYVGMFGTMLAAAVLLYYKPDTRHASLRLSHRLRLICFASIQTWALKEAKQRMEARGEKYKYEPSSPPPSPSPS
ncbi:ESSS subunit of NADH:ubiquinone oxidoreductase-domain-containing protein, partial [Pisolithus sp. B1]